MGDQDAPGAPGEVLSLDDLVKRELAPGLKVVRLLGRGSVARVYLAREPALDRQVAIKVLDPSKARDETVRRRFEREAKWAARISHPNVTAVHQIGRLSTGAPYIVMEYVDGRNLEDALAAGGPQSPSEARETLRQLASGLAAAHRQEVIHRDVKPANVLRQEGTGRVLLTDFGVAAIRDSAGTDTTRLTVEGELLGDLEYISPEQLSGEPVTELADIYSLGVLGYQLLTGRGPYEATGPAQIAAAHLRTPPTPLTVLRPGINRGLARLLERCLAKKPEHRPSATEVEKALSAEPAMVEKGPPEPDNAFGAFLAELKRRRVYRVAVAYAGGAFVLISGVPDTGLMSGDAHRILVAVVLAGFPVAVVLAWLYDIGSGGIIRTEDLPEVSPGRQRVRRMLQLAALGLSFLIAGLVGWLVLRP